jgi:hypothetical protein
MTSEQPSPQALPDRSFMVWAFVRIEASDGRAAMDKIYAELRRTRPTKDFHVSSAEVWPDGR